MGVEEIGFTALVLAALWAIYRFSAGKRRCWTCRHFDRATGQAAIASHPPFAMAATHVPPSVMGIPHEPDPDNPGQTRLSDKPRYPARARWSQFGACVCPANVDADGAFTLRWGDDVCESFQLVAPHTLVRRRREEFLER